MDDRSCKTYQPTKAARALVTAFVLPGTLLVGWVGTALLHRAFALGVGVLLLAVLLCAWTVFVATTRLTLTQTQLTRTWLGGSFTIPIDEITKFQWGGSRGQLNLVIRAGKNWMMLSSLSFREQELRDIANSILAARGLDEQPLSPPYGACIDVEEMAKQKRQARDRRAES